MVRNSSGFPLTISVEPRKYLLGAISVRGLCGQVPNFFYHKAYPFNLADSSKLSF